MNVVRSALTANNVAGLPNKRDYIHKERDRLMEERRQRLLATAIARDAETISVSNASVEAQDAALDDYDSPNDDDDADDDEDPLLDMAAMPAVPAPPIPAPPPQPIENRLDDLRADQNRRFRVQLRSQRFNGSHHEIRRRA